MDSGHRPSRRKRHLVVSVLFVIVASLAATGPTLANDIANFTTVFGTDVVHAGFGGMRNDGTGTLTVSGVSGTVTTAYLYWQGPTNSTDPSANAAVTFAGNAVTGTNIGFSNDNCWGFANSQAYRADVTSFVTGNGSYTLAGFVKASGNINVNGASLIVFYDDGSAANNRDVVLFDGNDSNFPNAFDANGWNVSLPGINYVSGTAAITMHVSDGQVYPDAALVLNASTLAPAGAVFQGDSVPFGTFDSGGHLWDIKSFDVTSFLSPGTNTLTLTTGLNNDCLSLVVAAIDLPAGAAPGNTLNALSDAHLWLGLRNSDDQGTQFDVKVELFRNTETSPLASGLTRCVINLTRNQTFAKSITVAWDPFTPVSLASGDVLYLKISTRIGTTPTGAKCAGPGGSHNNAVALRFYYDAASRNSNFDDTIGTTNTNLYFHSDGGGCDKPSATQDSQNVFNRFLDSNTSTGTLVRCKDSGNLNFNGGNPYTEVGRWTLP